MNHSHVLYDAGAHFKINATSRNISNESGKTTLVQYDHNSERFTFESPRHVEGHDMAQCNSVEIHYLNIEANTKKVKSGVYTVTDLQVKEDDEEKVVFSWVIGYNATQLIGQLNFIVRFACVSETTGAVEYAWHTTIHSGTMISNGIYNSDTGSDSPVPAFNFVTTVSGTPLKFFVGTKAEYDALDANSKIDMFAFITDDEEELLKAISDNKTQIATNASKIAKLDASNRLNSERINEIVGTYGKFSEEYSSVTCTPTTEPFFSQGYYHMQIEWGGMCFDVGIVYVRNNDAVRTTCRVGLDINTMLDMWFSLRFAGGEATVYALACDPSIPQGQEWERTTATIHYKKIF